MNLFRALMSRVRPCRSEPAIEPRRIWPSETSKCRARLRPFCVGCGLDIGPGGDPICDSAIRIDLAEPYSHVGKYSVQLTGDASQLSWFRDGVLDYVYSSHVLEDFADTEKVLCEWLRVLKPGGRLVLFCPDEQAFRNHCRETGQPYNPAHKHADFSIERVRNFLARIGSASIVHEVPLIDKYSWELVCVKN